MRADKEQRSFESTLASTSEELALGFSLGDEQKGALNSFLLKKDVFAVFEARKVGPSPTILHFHFKIHALLNCSRHSEYSTSTYPLL